MVVRGVSSRKQVQSYCLSTCRDPLRVCENEFRGMGWHEDVFRLPRYPSPNPTGLSISKTNAFFFLKQGLLVLAISSLIDIDKIDFKGQRFNSATSDDVNELYPDQFLRVIQEWSAEGLPFVADISGNEQVWPFPYDKVMVSESDTPPEGFSDFPQEVSVKYYHIEMSGTGYDTKKRVYKCYIEYRDVGHWL